MPFTAEVYQVMISCPGDVKEEKQIVRDVIAEWNAVHSKRSKIVVLPLDFENNTRPSYGLHPQKSINAQVTQHSDLLIALFSTRIGTATDTHPSGTIEEIEEHIQAGKDILLYFSDKATSLSSVDAEQYQQVKSFKASFHGAESKGLYYQYTSDEDFRAKFQKHFALKMSELTGYVEKESSFVEIGVRTDFVPLHQRRAKLSSESFHLLRSAAAGKDKNRGKISRQRLNDNLSVKSGDVYMVRNTSDVREVAKWEHCLKKLEENQFIQVNGEGRYLFTLTHEGFQIGEEPEAEISWA